MPEGPLFVVGNGPSLRTLPRGVLRGAAWIGMNAAYRAWAEERAWPRYYACLDAILGPSHGEAIVDMAARSKRLGIEGFLLRRNLVEAHPALAAHPAVTVWDDLSADEPLRAVTPVTTGSHAVLWGARMGYGEIVLLGMDGRYVERVAGARAGRGIALSIERQAANPNYYFDAYQQPGDRYSVPNPAGGEHRLAWRRAARALGDVRVVNATPGSALDRFERGRLSVGADGTTVTASDAPPPASVDDPEGRITPVSVLSALAPSWYGRLWDEAGRIGSSARAWGWRVAVAAPEGGVRWDVAVPAAPCEPERCGGLLLIGGGEPAARLGARLDERWDEVLVLRRRGDRVTLGAPDGAPLRPSDALIGLRERWPPMPDADEALRRAASAPCGALRRRLRSARSRLAQQVRAAARMR